jgi:hypothetical protein
VVESRDLIEEWRRQLALGREAVKRTQPQLAHA